MENTSVLNVRISEQLKQKLEELATEQGQTVSDLVRKMLEKAVTQDDDYISGISPGLLEQIRGEAVRRNMPTTQLITLLLRTAFERLRKNTRMVIFD